MHKLIVISGCSGGGKSTLLEELNLQGYSVIAEVGREIVKQQLQSKSPITPWENPKQFCELLIDRSIAAWHRGNNILDTKNNLVFFDRSFLEGISYYQTLNILDSQKYDHFVDELRYYPTIFMTPPWKEIYIQDNERRHSFTEAVQEYERLEKAYPRFNYQIVELPKVTVKARVQFILGAVYNS